MSCFHDDWLILLQDFFGAMPPGHSVVKWQLGQFPCFRNASLFPSLVILNNTSKLLNSLTFRSFSRTRFDSLALRHHIC